MFAWACEMVSRAHRIVSSRVGVRYAAAMNTTVKIEIDAQTAELLEARAAARGMSLADWLADVAGDENALSADMQAQRAAADGPWAPDILAEDARRLAEFHRTRIAAPWDGVKAWMQSWGTPHELPPPTLLKL